MSLTNAEQKTYVKKVRELIAEMAETFPYFAEEMSARSSLFQHLWNLGLPAANSEELSGYTDEAISYAVERSLQNAMGYYKAVDAVKVSKLPDYAKTETAEKYRQSLYWVSVAAAQAHKIQNKELRKKTLETIVIPASKAVLSNEHKIKTIASEPEYAFARDEILKKALAGEIGVTASFPVPGLKYFGEKLTNPNIPPPPQKQAQEKNKTPEQKLPDPVPPTTAKNPLPSTEANAHYYRCIYAGYVIKQDPCIAPSELPWELSGLDSKNFSCEDGTVMCNPFIFGFSSQCDWMTALEKGRTENCWSSAKPYCVKPGLYATKSCTALSNSDNSLQAAVELIRQNKTAFNQFGESFADLCFKGLIDFNSYPRKRTPQNKQKTKDDIKRTCTVASARIKEIEKRYGFTKTEKAANAPLTGKDLLMWKPATQPGKK